MSLVKSKAPEYRTILDVSERKKVSKNFVRETLRKAEVLQFTCHEDMVQVIHNEIKIGMYTMYLDFADRDLDHPRHKLREYGGVGLWIYDDKSGEPIYRLDKDDRFKNQHWTAAARFHKMHLNDLVDAIIYCSKLNKLKAFL